MLGGPLYQVLRRTHLVGDALQLLRRRLVVLTFLAWVPLLVLSIVEGHAWGTSVVLPFIADIELHVRFLVAMPLLILAELIVHQRMRPVVLQFLERGLIPESERAKFDAAIAEAMRLRNSVWAEGLLLAFVYVVGVGLLWRTQIALPVSSWHGAPVRRRMAANDGRVVAGLREPAALPVPAPSLVFPACSSGPGSCGKCHAST